MGQPARIGIATSGYRTGNGSPEKICIATHGYRCQIGVIVVDPRDGDGGTGIRFVQTDTIPEDKTELVKLTALAIIAIEEMYD